MTPFETRKYFPHISTGRIFMDHASVSPLSLRVTEKLNNYFEQRSISHIENYFDYKPVLDGAKEKLANLINCTPDRIAWKDNVTNGINTLASSLDWKKGDRILLNDLEFPANVYPFLNLQRQGVIVDFVKSEKGKIDINKIEEMIRPETRLLSISQVQFLSGYRADLESIGALCKQKGIIFCVDAIQGLGAVRLDVKKSCIDFLAGGTQKWLMGMKGLGFIYVSEELQAKMIPAYAGWLAVKNAWNLLDYKLDYNEDATRFEPGTVNAPAIAALYASLELMEETGYSDIENTIIDNALYLYNRLKELSFDLMLQEADRKCLAGIVSFKSGSGEYIQAELLKNKINIALREGYIRISPHFYNTREEIDIVINMIKQLKK